MASKILKDQQHRWHREGDCFIWHSYLNSAGRPYYEDTGKKVRVAREVLAEKLGRPIAEGMECCHVPECHNKACINPEHLYEGTRSRNEMDKPPDVRRRGIEAAHKVMKSNDRS